MHKYINHLISKKVLNSSQDWVFQNIQYLILHGSHAYGINTEKSDIDLYGFTMPPKDYVFPYDSHVYGFDVGVPTFDQTVISHIPYTRENGQQTEIDCQIYNITKFLRLVMENNPNMIETLFVNHTCRLIESQNIGSYVRLNRGYFLHKGIYHKMKSYAFSQLKKCKSQTREGKRKEVVEQHGYDLKFASHIFRLADECEQFLTLDYKDIDLQRNREELKAIRRGEMTLEWIEEQFYSREKSLETAYQNSKLPHSPNIDVIRNILMECLEMFYGSIDKTVKHNNSLLHDLQTLLKRYQ